MTKEKAFIRALFENGACCEGVEELAIKHGIAEIVERDAPCNDTCQCFDGSYICFRLKLESAND